MQTSERRAFWAERAAFAEELGQQCACIFRDRQGSRVAAGDRRGQEEGGADMGVQRAQCLGSDGAGVEWWILRAFVGHCKDFSFTHRQRESDWRVLGREAQKKDTYLTNTSVSSAHAIKGYVSQLDHLHKRLHE